MKPICDSTIDISGDGHLVLNLSSAEKEWARDWLNQVGICEDDFLAGIHPGASSFDKIWPEQFYAQVADRLINQYGAKMLILCSDSEIDLAANIQRNMANEWRIGIDNENKVNLITKGMFGISRNPIFLGVIIVFIGLFLIIPNAVIVVILVSGVIVIQVQVRLEEEFLLNQLGNEYKEYMSKVKRWIF